MCFSRRISLVLLFTPSQCVFWEPTSVCVDGRHDSLCVLQPTRSSWGWLPSYVTVASETRQQTIPDLELDFEARCCRKVADCERRPKLVWLWNISEHIFSIYCSSKRNQWKFHASVQKWACLFNVGHVGISWDLCFCEAEIKWIKKLGQAPIGKGANAAEKSSILIILHSI